MLVDQFWSRRLRFITHLLRRISQGKSTHFFGHGLLLRILVTIIAAIRKLEHIELSCIRDQIISECALRFDQW